MLWYRILNPNSHPGVMLENVHWSYAFSSQLHRDWWWNTTKWFKIGLAVRSMQCPPRDPWPPSANSVCLFCVFGFFGGFFAAHKWHPGDTPTQDEHHSEGQVHQNEHDFEPEPPHLGKIIAIIDTEAVARGGTGCSHNGTTPPRSKTFSTFFPLQRNPVFLAGIHEWAQDVLYFNFALQSRTSTSGGKE